MKLKSGSLKRSTKLKNLRQTHQGEKKKKERDGPNPYNQK